MSRRLRLLLLALVLAAVGIVAYLHRDTLQEAAQLMGRASLRWLLPAAVAIAGVYFCRAVVYAVALRLLGYSLGTGFLWGTAVVATSLNQLVPIAGATGYAFLSYAFMQRGVAAGEASLVALVDTMSYAISAATLVVAGLGYLLAGGGLAFGSLAVASAPGLVVLVLVVYLYRLQRDRPRLTALVLRGKHRVARRVGRRWSDAPIRRFLDQYYEGKALIGSQRAAFALMLAFQYLVIACDFLALYFALLSLGSAPKVWTVFMGLILAMAGLTVVAVPAGGGSFEVILSTFLATHGVPPAASVAAAVLYRVVAFWLPVVVSLLVLLQLRRQWGAGVSGAGGAGAPPQP